MAMTKSRKTRSGAAVQRVEFTPSLEGLLGSEALERLVDLAEKEVQEEARELTESGSLAATAFGAVRAHEIKSGLLLEQAFRRLATIERELKSAKSMSRKSLNSRFSLDDLNVEQIDDRNVRLVLRRGGDEAEFALKFPAVIDRGTWHERAMYERGDGVTHAGSYWIAQADGPGRPGTDGTWRLAVKRGRDGKDAAA